jgi:hypothetical protein
MAVLVFTIPLLGLGAAPAIFALFLYSLLPIVRNTYQGLHDIPGNLRESAIVLGLTRWARLKLVELPLASTSILAGIKTAAVINVGTATIGALVGAGGYGQPILTGIRLGDFSLVLQGAIPAALLAVVVQSGFGLGERWFVPAGKANRYDFDSVVSSDFAMSRRERERVSARRFTTSAMHGQCHRVGMHYWPGITGMSEAVGGADRGASRRGHERTNRVPWPR